MTGPFKEAQKGHVDWPDLDVATFQRFIQWLDDGDYQAPKPAKKSKAYINNVNMETPPFIKDALELPLLKGLKPVYRKEFDDREKECTYCNYQGCMWGANTGDDDEGSNEEYPEDDDDQDLDEERSEDEDE